MDRPGFERRGVAQKQGSGACSGRSAGVGAGCAEVTVGPLLETKLRVPRRRQGWVPRPRLVERLDRGVGSALTLVSAPAGFGKTTLLTEWLAGWTAGAGAGGRSVAWVSLDRRDDDPALFWRYVVAALQTVVAGVGERALTLLQPPRAPVEAVLAALALERPGPRAPQDRRVTPPMYTGVRLRMSS